MQLEALTLIEALTSIWISKLKNVLLFDFSLKKYSKFCNPIEAQCIIKYYNYRPFITRNYCIWCFNKHILTFFNKRGVQLRSSSKKLANHRRINFKLYVYINWCNFTLTNHRRLFLLFFLFFYLDLHFRFI